MNKKHLFKSLLLFLLTIVMAYPVYSCEVIDDSGKKIQLTHPANRIISLAPDLTEILFADGAGKKIVGVIQGSDYPASAKKIPVVASYHGVDAEAILALHPDLIVAWSEESFAPQLYKLGIPVYLSHQRKITDVPKTMQKLACLADTTQQSENAIQSFSKTYAQLQKKYSQRKTVSVFYQVWSAPLITITKKSWINDAITLCGAKNVFANLSGAAPEVNIEAVIKANPDVIIGANAIMWQKWSKLSAVKAKHIFSVNPDLIERASPRILQGVEQLCELIEVVRENR